MQKLVSKNSVQRFKEGKKIQKFQNPSSGITLIDEKNDIWQDSSGKQYQRSWIGRKRNISPNEERNFKRYFSEYSVTPQQRIGMNGKPIVDTITNASSNNNQQQQIKDYSWMKGGTRQRTAEEEARLKDPKVQAYLNRQQSSTVNPQKKSMNPRFQSAYSNRASDIGGANKIKEWQSKLGVKADGIWGDKTEAAYQWYLTQQNLPTIEKNPDSEQNIKPIISDINLPSKTLNSIAINQEPITPEQQTEQSIINNNFSITENEGGQKYFSRNGNYNRSQVRDYMRSMGLNPYNFTGGQRRALRRFLNNEGKGGEYLGKQLYDLFVKPYGYKQGGQLVSRDPITRFKNKIK